MFLATCDICGRRELRGTRSIDALVNTHDGIDLHFSCRACGSAGVVTHGARETRSDDSPLRAVA